MKTLDLPCLSLAIAPLTAHQAAHWAIWVTQSPYLSGQVHYDCFWPEILTETWRDWQHFFSQQRVISLEGADVAFPLPNPQPQPENKSSNLMQSLGLGLWQWVFNGEIHTAFTHSQGIARGQGNKLRVRLDLRDPRLMVIPWEIMQPQTAKNAIGVNPQLLFSRTSCDVDPLIALKSSSALNILLVLGDEQDVALNLEAEAQLFKQTLLDGMHSSGPMSGQVNILIKPTREELLGVLEQGDYTLFFYAGHGETGPTGGRLFLQGQETLTGTELAQALVQSRVTLAVFNSCWGAQLDEIPAETPGENTLVPRSSLAETLLHHGVPAVLGMRDIISDEEALCFLQRFIQVISDRCSIDEAVTLARQHLLSRYGFNQPTWTLPILYMHPDFQGELTNVSSVTTDIPTNLPFLNPFPQAELRLQTNPEQIWAIKSGLLRVGRRVEKDLVLPEQWVSQRHAEIICRNVGREDIPTYFLKDFSRFGTLVFYNNQWQRIHHQEIMLASGTLIRFGSTQGEILEFFVQS